MSADRTTPPEAIRDPQLAVERIVRAVWNRLHIGNKHFIGVCVGREGIGKSHTAMSIAAAVDPDFTAEKVLFGAEPLLEILRDEEYSRGDMYVVDEAGVSFGSRTWQSRGQVRANQALQLIRSHNIGVIFTLPRLGELDSQTQGRLQALIELLTKKDSEFVRAKWKWVKPKRGEEGGIKTPFPTIDGAKVRSVRVGPPPERVVGPYEKQKAKFQREMYDEALEELGDDEDEETLSPTEIAADIGDDVTDYLREINGGAQTILDRRRIATEYDVGRPRSRQIKQILVDNHANDLPDNIV